jgi:hypothetical protein
VKRQPQKGASGFPLASFYFEASPMPFYAQTGVKHKGPPFVKELCAKCKGKWTKTDEKEFHGGFIKCAKGEQGCWYAFNCLLSVCPYLLEHQMCLDYDILEGYMDMETDQPAKMGKGSLSNNS